MKSYVFGYHAVKSLLEQTPERVKQIFVLVGKRDGRIDAVIRQAKRSQITVQQLSRCELDNLVPQQVHQGLVAWIATQENAKQAHLSASLEDLVENLQQPAFLLVLDGVQDPHNLGACLRSANAAGVDAVIIPKDRAVGITPVVRKVACGAVEHTPLFQVTNLARTLQYLQQQGVWVFGAAEEAEQSIYKLDFSGSVAIVLGAEGEGMRSLTRRHCDHIFRIPCRGKIASLNVSVATGICLFEVLRQRL